LSFYRHPDYGNLWYYKIPENLDKQNVGKSYFIPLGKQVAKGQWVHVAMTWGAGENALYIDGSRVPATSIEPNSMSLIIGKADKLVFGAEPAPKTFSPDGAYDMSVSPLKGFKVFDTVVPGGTNTTLASISSVTDDSFKIPGIGGKLVAGETVTATLVAQPGGKASFDMGRVKEISMVELPADPGGPGKAPVAAGTYRGSYTIKPGDDFEEGKILGRFASADNVAAEPVLSSSKWTIETKPVVTFSIANKDLPADQGTKSRIKLVAKDANGNPLKGRNLKLTLSTTDEYTGTVGAGDFGKQVGASVETRWKGTTDAWGEVEFDYVAGFAAKTVILQAKDLDSGGVSVDYLTAYKEASIDIALTAPRSLAAARRGMQYTIKVEASRTTLTADGKSRSVIRATVSDPNGKPVAGDAVTFALSSPNGTLRTIVGATDAAGVATAEYIAGKKIGIVVISATDTVRNISGNVSILLLADAPAKIILKARPESLPADGNSKADIQVKVTDINDNPNKDTKVEFKVKQGVGKLDYADRTTDTFGDALNRFQAGTTPGIATILATVRSRVPTAAELLKAKNVLFVPYNEASESIRIEKWLKKKGDTVLMGEPIVSYTVGRSSEIKTIDAPYDLTMGETLVE
ncbi:MAG TPA: invasin domain 3-containing protein, partial [Candidatus Deferrimicrobiaceae bacterium]